MPLFSPLSQRTNTYGVAPEDHGLLVWNYDPALATASSSLTTAGMLQGARVYIPRNMLITNLFCHVITAGATLTANQCKAAIYDSAGALKGTTTDQATAWQSVGGKVMPLVASFTATAGLYDIVMWYNGTTSPNVARAGTAQHHNTNLLTSALRFFTVNNGTTTAAPATLPTKVAGSFGWFVGAS